MMVSYVSGGTPYLTYHTTNRYRRSMNQVLADWGSANYYEDVHDTFDFPNGGEDCCSDSPCRRLRRCGGPDESSNPDPATLRGYAETYVSLLQAKDEPGYASTSATMRTQGILAERITAYAARLDAVRGVVERPDPEGVRAVNGR